MAKRLSSRAVLALQEALSVIYHFKKDLRRFLLACGVNNSLLSQVNWGEGQYKRQIVADLFDLILPNQVRFLPVITKLCREVAEMDNFAHLARLEDGPRKVAAAHAAVAELRRLVDSHQTLEEEERLIEERRVRRIVRETNEGAFQAKLREIRSQFLEVAANEEDPQRRGTDLEAAMTGLFDLFDLDPRASFRIKGEQIDGAFTLDGTDYIFEAKWEREPIDRAAIDVFVSKVGRKLDNTLGLLLSMNGFEQSAIDKYSDRRSTVLLMERYDLQAVLEERIDFVEMLRRKRRHAAETGSVFFPVYPTVL
jgi:hypothetical protein